MVDYKWFNSDFAGGIVPFFSKYGDENLKAALGRINGKIKVKYLEYDRSLNGK